MTPRCEWCGKFYGPKTVERHRVCWRLQAERESGYHPLYGVVPGSS